MKVATFASVTIAAGVLALSCGCAATAKPAADDSAASHSASPPASSSAAMSPPPASPASPVANPPATSSGGTSKSSQSGAPSACATSALKVATGTSNGAAGSFYFNLVFTNTGSSPCTLYGYPGVSFATAGHSQLGQSAARVTDAARIVTLIPNGSAAASVRIPDVTVYSNSDCRPTTATYIKVYPPNQFSAAYVPTHAQVCTTSTGRSQIGTVVAGTTAGA